MRSQITPELLGTMDRFLSICVGARVVACRGKEPSDGSSNKISGNKFQKKDLLSKYIIIDIA